MLLLLNFLAVYLSFCTHSYFGLRMSSNSFSPVRATVDVAKIVRDGVFFTSDIASTVQSGVKSVPGTIQNVQEKLNSVQEVVKSVPETIKEIQTKASTIPSTFVEFQSKVQAAPAVLFERVDSTTNDALKLQSQISANIAYTASIFDPKNIEGKIVNKKRNVEANMGKSYKGVQDTYNSVQKAYFATLKAFSPQTYVDYFNKKAEEKEQLKYEMLVKKQEERNNARKFHSTLIDVKESIYTAIDTVVEAKEKAVLLSKTTTSNVETIVQEIQSIPGKVEVLIKDVQSIPDKIDNTKNGVMAKLEKIQQDVVRLQATIEAILRDIQAIPSVVQTSYMKTKSTIENTPAAIKRDIELKKEAAAALAAVCWRILTLQDVIAAFTATKEAIDKTSEKLSNVQKMFQPKSPSTKVVAAAATAAAAAKKEESPFQKTWKVLVAMTSTISIFFQGVNGLKSRVDSELKRQEEREKSFRAARSLQTSVVTSEPSETSDGEFTTMVIPSIIAVNNTTMASV